MTQWQHFMSPDERAYGKAVVRLLDAFPELGEKLSPQVGAVAERRVLAAVLKVGVGRWLVPSTLRSEPGHLGFLVIDGLMTRSIALGDSPEAVATELIGSGNLLRPGDQDEADPDEAPVPVTVEWTVLAPTELAVLDRRFMVTISEYPELRVALMRMALRRAKWLAFQLAVGHLRRVDSRLLVLLWGMSDRWGRVRPDGVQVPLRLTHQTLGWLVGAHRSSVTTALTQLAHKNRVKRLADGTWLLSGEPPQELQRMRELVGE